MTVLVLGDAHAEAPENREALLAAYEAADARADVDVALQVGDLGYYDPPTPTWFVAGNNEDLDVVDSILATLAPDLCLVGHFHRHAESTLTFDGTRTRVVSLAPAWESYYTLDPETLALERHATPSREA